MIRSEAEAEDGAALCVLEVNVMIIKGRNLTNLAGRYRPNRFNHGALCGECSRARIPTVSHA